MLDAASRKERHLQKYHSISLMLNDDESTVSSSMGKLHDKMIKSLAALNLYKIQSDHTKAKKIAHDLYRTSSKYHAPKYLHEAADYLYTYYCLFEFDRKKAIKYANTKKDAFTAYTWECKIASYRTEVILAERSPHSRKHTISLYEEYWKLINPTIGMIKSWEFNRMAYLFGCQYYFKLNNFDSLLVIAENAIKYLESFSLQSNTTLAIFYKYKLHSLPSYNHTPELDTFLDKYDHLVKKGTTNWFNYKYSVCRLRFIQKDHLKSTNILNDVFNNAKFKRIPDANRASWKIINAYHNFYMRADRSVPTPSRFKIARFINDTKDHQLQTTGERTQLNIVQLLYHLLDKNTKAIEQSTSAIEKYIARIDLRLKDRKAYIFIKMLLAVPANQYHSEAIERHTRIFRKKLQRRETDINISLESIEIIPYERLWEMIMENLKK